MTGTFVAQPAVSLNGSPLADDLHQFLTRAVVDVHAHLPRMAVVEFTSQDRALATKLSVAFGSTLQVGTTTAAGGAPEVLFIGEVTALEQEADGAGTRLIVRGYDKLHRLCRGRRTRTFADMTDVDIVRQVATAAGLDVGQLDSDGVVHTYVSQMNQTDWDFLRARANVSGRELATEAGVLTWLLPGQSSRAPAAQTNVDAPPQQFELLLGRDLTRFAPRVTAAEQVSEVQVRGWDPAQKQAIVGSAPAKANNISVGADPSALASTFDAVPYVLADQPIDDQSEADSLAAVLAAQISGASAEAEGTAFGDPTLMPGAAVRIGGLGWPHDGAYVLSAARHVFDELGYHTDFSVSGGQERSLLGLVSGGATKGVTRSSGALQLGLVVGQVSDVNDPDGQFRVRVSFPWLSDDYESWWCRVAQPGAGNGRGLVWLPEVGDEVLVGFAHGDTRVPFVVGGLYNGIDLPPMADSLVDSGSGEVTTRALVSRTNHRLVLSESNSDASVRLCTGDDGYTILLDQTNTAITIDSSGTVSIHGSQGITITSDGDLSLSASGSMSLSANTGMTLDGGPSVSVSGSIIKLN